MKIGLHAHTESSLKMIPTFVTKLPHGTEQGIAYAIDIGGSNVRVLEVSLDGKGHAKPIKGCQSIKIPDIIQQSDADTLFDFIADCIGKVVGNDPERLGFTFSFPIEQKTIDSGLLITWTKGFTVTGVVNQDVVSLLNKSCLKKNINAQINVLINDTVGTMLTGCYQEVQSDCCVGVIIGTGTNACYIEKIENIKKLSADSTDDVMVVNLESGNFGSRPDRIGTDLPLTKWDRIVNEESVNPDYQIYEKQVSGMYLGEIVRILLCHLINNEGLFEKLENYSFDKKYVFSTEDMTNIEMDPTPTLDTANKKLTAFGIKSTLDERRFLKSVIHAVAARGAILAAIQIAACLKQMNKEDDEVVIAVDGSLFEKYYGFKDKIQETLQLLLKHNKVKLILAKDGSGVGAALASFMLK